MNRYGSGCPLCGGWDGYYGGTDLPCDNCVQAFKKVQKKLPPGTSIVAWNGAKNAYKRVTSKGGTKEEAKEAMRKEILSDLEIGAAFSAAYSSQFSPAKPEELNLDDLFGTLFPG